MTDTSEPVINATPDMAYSSGSREAMSPEFKPVDRTAGWLVVNRWTMPLMRRLGPVVLPKPDVTGVTLTEEPGAGQGAIVVRPDEITGTGAMLYIHGGGHVIGEKESALPSAIELARRVGVPVVCSSYRLAPENRFPAGLDDCHAAWTWLMDSAERLNIDAGRIVVGGISAGGTHAAALAQRLHDEGGQQPSAQLLTYPMLDDRTAARFGLDKPRHRVWSNANNRFGWTSYLGQPPGAVDTPRYSVPSRRDDLSGLAPAWIGVGTADLFLDEDREYARRLAEAGVDVSYAEVPGGIHGFDLEPSASTMAFRESQAEFLRTYTR